MSHMFHSFMHAFAHSTVMTKTHNVLYPRRLLSYLITVLTAAPRELTGVL